MANEKEDDFDLEGFSQSGLEDDFGREKKVKKQTEKTGRASLEGQAVILGEVDRILMRKVIRKNLKKIKSCYVSELNKTPTLSGSVKVQFVITSNGTVSKSSIQSSTMNNKTVENCIASHIEKFKFPKPSNRQAAIVTFPFSFHPN